jgi:hypothetical protein
MPKTLHPKVRTELLEKGLVMLETFSYCREQYHRADIGLSVEQNLVREMLNDIALATALEELDEQLKQKQIEAAKEDTA